MEGWYSIFTASLLVLGIRWSDGWTLVRDPYSFTRTIRMPDAVSKDHDALLCHAEKLDDRTAYIVRYEPHASKTRAHHLMVYGCSLPGSRKPYWSCGEGSDRSERSVCLNGERQVVFAWALDAPSMNLPEGVGFRVGGTTGIDYIVIQLHYVHRFPEGLTDDSGVTLHMTFTPVYRLVRPSKITHLLRLRLRKYTVLEGHTSLYILSKHRVTNNMTFTLQPKQAGFYVIGDSGYIPPHIPEFHMESACEYEDYTIYPIGYRTHSHNLGLVTSGYRIRNGHWTEIGRMSPQLPQTFYNITNEGMSIRYGDILASRCTMNSMHREDHTMIGATNDDEMCNFYILYYTYKKENLHIRYCFRDAQHFQWKDYLDNIPDDASSLDGIPNIEYVLDKFRTRRLPTFRKGRRHYQTM